MKHGLRSPWLWVALLLFVMLVGGSLFLWPGADNVVSQAVDTLSSVPLSDRWSLPEMLKIRQLGDKAIPPLRQVLLEKDRLSTRVLLWVKMNWPSATKYYSHFPDSEKLTDRRWAACQVLQTLGPAGKAAVPELVDILKSRNLSDINAATTALHAIGIDADICDRLDAVFEQGVPEFARRQITGALAFVNPPSERTVKVLTAALSDISPYVRHCAVDTIVNVGLGAPAPEIVSTLKHLQFASTDDLVVVSSSAALWQFGKSADSTLPVVLQVLSNQIPVGSWPGGNSGQGAGQGDQIFMLAGNLFQKMNLREPDKSLALALYESWCDSSDRIYVRLLLLPAMMNLGLPGEKCLEVCRTGLRQSEDFYRIQAARLLVDVSEKTPVSDSELETLIHDPEVGVRVYAARIHWRQNRQASVVVPILMEALDRPKHQSYYYAEIQPVALSTLGDIGAEARSAAPALEQTVRDPNPGIAELASATLAKIRR
jgi:HEAT repeat protein